MIHEPEKKHKRPGRQGSLGVEWLRRREWERRTTLPRQPAAMTLRHPCYYWMNSGTSHTERYCRRRPTHSWQYNSKHVLHCTRFIIIIIIILQYLYSALKSCKGYRGAGGFRLRLSKQVCFEVWQDLMSDGSEFQVCGAATEIDWVGFNVPLNTL